jgi:pimeloyl-ACP methyl ester carboxylesterase
MQGLWRNRSRSVFGRNALAVSLSTALLCILAFLPASPASASPRSFVERAPSGNSIDLDVYGERGPAIMILHGFMSSKDHHKDTAEMLAQSGFIVIVPDLTYDLWTSNHAERALDVQFLLDRLRQGAYTHPPDRIALVGHSAGGLTALLAASGQSVSALVLLDPVVSAGRPGTRTRAISDLELQRISVPVLVVEGAPHACNNYRDRGFEMMPLLGASVKERIVLLDASHCDFMDRHLGCQLFCGRGSEESRQLALDSMMVFLNRYAK